MQMATPTMLHLLLAWPASGNSRISALHSSCWLHQLLKRQFTGSAAPLYPTTRLYSLARAFSACRYDVPLKRGMWAVNIGECMTRWSEPHALL